MRRAAVAGVVVAATVVALTVAKVADVHKVTAAPAQRWVTYVTWPPRVTPPTGLSANVLEAANRAADLVEENEKDFLGSYVDDDGRVVIRARSAYGRALATRSLGGDPNVVVKDAFVNIDDARELGTELRVLTASLSTKLTTWGPWPMSGGMFVWLRTDPTDRDRAEIEKFAEQHAVPIEVSVTHGAGGAPVDDR